MRNLILTAVGFVFMCSVLWIMRSQASYALPAAPSSQSLLEKRYKVGWPESELLGHAVDMASKKYSIDNKLLLAVINHETHFRPRTSKAGAVGYMQVRPNFWHKSKECSYNVYDTHANVLAGACVLAHYRSKLGTIEDALVAYNVGPNAISTIADGVRYRNEVLEGAK